MSALDPLATVDDLQIRLPGGVDSEDRAEVLLNDASAVARKYTGQQFTLETTTLALCKLRKGMVRLPQRPVLAVSTVEDVNENTLEFTWLGDDRVQVSPQVFDTWSMVPYTNALSEVKVTYDHGYEEIPFDVISVVCNMVARAFGHDPGDGGITQESIEGYSYTVGTIGAAGAVGLLPDEQRSLAIYGRVGGVIQTA